MKINEAEIIVGLSTFWVLENEGKNSRIDLLEPSSFWNKQSSNESYCDIRCLEIRKTATVILLGMFKATIISFFHVM